MLSKCPETRRVIAILLSSQFTVFASCTDQRFPTDEEVTKPTAEYICVSKIENFSVRGRQRNGVSASVAGAPTPGTVSLDEWICGMRSGSGTLARVTVWSDLPQFAPVSSVLAGLQALVPAGSIGSPVSFGGINVAPIAGSNVYGPPPKPEWMTDADWDSMGEYLQRAFTDAIQKLCSDSALPPYQCGLLRSGALRTAVRNTQNAMTQYPYGVPWRSANGLQMIEPVEFGRRWAFAAAEFVRQLRLRSEFSDVSSANLLAAATGMAIASLADTLFNPEQSVAYEPSIAEAARRAYLISPTDLGGPWRVAESMYNAGNYFPHCVPTSLTGYDAITCQSGGSGGGGGGGNTLF